MKLSVIIPAAGLSTRFDSASGRSKLEEDLGGRPVLQRTIELFIKRDDVAEIIVAGPHESYDEFILRHGDKLSLLGVRVCKGGKDHRWETVRNALQEVSDDATHVAVHDAARPCAPIELIDRVFEAAKHHDAVIPGYDVPDTIKRVGEQEEAAPVDPLDAILGGAGKTVSGLRTVEETVSRERLVLVQTPQVFSLELLKRAYAQDDLSSTDDAGLVEKLGEPVYVVEGDPRNIKITRPVDLSLARSILHIKPPTERAAHKRF